MSYRSQIQRPLTLAAAAGALGIVLRTILYRTGFDNRGILSSGHPLHLACIALAAVLGLYLLIVLPRSKDAPAIPETYPQFCRRSFAAGFAGGCLLLLHGLSLVKNLGTLLPNIRLVLALAGGLGAMISVSPMAATPGRMLACHCSLCGHFALELLCRYQEWSGNPQLPDYFFQVLACAALALGTYQRMAFDVGLGKTKAHGFYCLMALCLCLMSLVGPDGWAFYLGGALWAIAALDAQTPPEKINQKEENDVPA